ncbi:ABC-2 type transport system ATP-binding protein [Anaerocolumna jejuensis DSM 15929]|uniref:ABC-2 type transport system ATP-binding protein n=1 Tax=Anaerocolumna jejuensis DSM 15929 TaxID=1121322 RepID=A0A1M7CQH2_9FIRM|nr:ABC transporter ATP-binding protein [Anaerocolumna jejuensis]SHL69442.1 ABC-2 type transport system ATP-binding protein [Anaerocolumna jejuensis DSM 15929]
MLQLKNITKKYKDFTAVDDISFEVNKGEIFGLLGPNGAGKSTLVSMIGTILQPTKGEIFIGGISLGDKPCDCKKQMGIVPQELALYQSLNAKDNLEFFGSLYGLYGNRLKQRVSEVLDILKLTDRRNQDISEYSGGMKRRVNLGIALMNSPRLLILDEPTVGIDPQSRSHILDTIRRLNEEEGMTVVYTSHYMEEVEYLCERIGIADHGKLIALGSKDGLKQDLNACDTLTASFGKASPDALGKLESIKGVRKASIEKDTITLLVSPGSNVLDIVDDIKNSGIRLTGFRYDEINLESIFLQLTGKSLRD